MGESRAQKRKRPKNRSNGVGERGAPEVSLTYAEWCRERGFDPETRTYRDDDAK